MVKILDNPELHALLITSKLLIYLTTCINPIIYVLMSSEYRQVNSLSSEGEYRAPALLIAPGLLQSSHVSACQRTSEVKFLEFDLRRCQKSTFRETN